MAVQPLRKQNARIAVGLRLVGAPISYIADHFDAPMRSITATLDRHGIMPKFRRDFASEGESFRITEAKHAELRLPKWTPLLADGVSSFNQRIAAVLFDALEEAKP